MPLKSFLCILLFAASHYAVLGQTIFLEDFEDEGNNSHSGTATGTPGGTWTSTTPGGQFRVTDNAFRINSTAGEAVWTSSVIDISSFGYAVLDVTFFGIGLFDADDYISVRYIADNNGVEVEFGEFLPFLIDAETQASAIVSANTIQLVIRAADDSPNFFGTGFLQFDDVTITAADILYSRKSGTWTDVTGGFGGTGTWSTNRSGTPACGCVPLNDVVAVIQNGHTVTLPTSQTAVGGSGTANLAPGAVDVENGGILRFNTNAVTLGIQQGLLRVRNGGLINSSSGAVTGEAISFNGDVPAPFMIIDAGGAISVEDLEIGVDASTDHFISGGGSLSLSGDITINADGASLTNNLTTSIAVGNRIQFPANVNNSSLVNNGTVSASQIFFNDDPNTVTNNGTMTLNSILVNNNSDDNNTIENNGSLTLNGATSIDANAADFFINNSGSIVQLGNFADLVAASDFVNESTGTWEWQLNNNVLPANIASVLDCSSNGNTFYYSGTANQNIVPITYHHLVLSQGGSKTPSANMDVNGNLSIETGTTLSAGTFSLDVEGNIAMNGTGILSGTGNIAIGGNWSATDANSFVQATRVVTFDGASDQSISNLSGSEIFYSLSLNKSIASNSVTLANEITVSQTLTLTQGRLMLDGNALRVTRSNAGAITGASASSFIVSETTTAPYSRVIWTTGSTNATFVFPFGTSGGSYVPYSLAKTIGAGATATVSVATYSTAANNTPYPASVTHVADGTGTDQSAQVIDRFWVVETAGYATLVASQSLTYAASEATAVGTPRTAQRWNGTNAWVAGVGSSSANPFPVPSASLAASSIWVVASTAAALPVEWYEFTARLRNHEVVINFKTASETNNDYFIVERAQDIELFEEIARVDSKGEASTLTSYSVVDENPLYGKTYYRIKQIDRDGTYSYSNLEKVVYEGPELAVLEVYPNPADGDVLMLNIEGLKEAKSVDLQIIDSRGRVLLETRLSVDTPGSLRTELHPPSKLPPGVYIVRAGATRLLTSKLVVK